MRFSQGRGGEERRGEERMEDKRAFQVKLSGSSLGGRFCHS